MSNMVELSAATGLVRCWILASRFFTLDRLGFLHLLENHRNEQGDDDEAGVIYGGLHVAAVEVGGIASSNDLVHAWMLPSTWSSEWGGIALRTRASGAFVRS